MQKLTPEQKAILERGPRTPEELVVLQDARWKLKDIFVDAIHAAVDEMQQRYPGMSPYEISFILGTEASKTIYNLERTVFAWLEMKVALAATAAMDPLQFLDPKAQGKEEEA